MQFQSKRCPHSVTQVAVRSSKQSVHVLPALTDAGTVSRSRTVRFPFSSIVEEKSPSTSNSDETRLDDRPVSTLLNYDPEADSASPDEKGKLTILDLETVSGSVRAGRTCTLCLEERTATCVTECGHLLDWNCIYSWGRERAECPLCRQSLNLTKLLPIYNL